MDIMWKRALYIIVTFSFISCDTTSHSDGVTATMAIDHETHRCETKLAACSIKLDGTALADNLRGPKGDKGEKGDPGPPGSCVCITAPVELPSSTTVSTDDDDDICGDEDDCLRVTTVPAPRKKYGKDETMISCKHAPAGTKNGTYFIRAEDPFEVYCDMTRNLSCLTLEPKDNTTASYFEHDDKPFWISQTNNTEGEKFDLRQFYGYELDQIEWLQRHSTFVTQTIRYHCNNSLLHTDDENALHLLSWSDSLIGPHPTNLTPAYYNIVSNECMNHTEEFGIWKHADIVITGTARRLPIIDFHIRDIRKEDQRFYLELRELCFG